MTKASTKRSVTIDRHRTSISLEEPFWDALSKIAEAEGKSLAALIGEIDKLRGDENLSAAIRLYVLGRARLPREH
jgi:predicted DNA-binding ribbon-helix-helix protein